MFQRLKIIFRARKSPCRNFFRQGRSGDYDIILLRLYVFQEQRADFLYPLANAAVVGETEHLRDFDLRVPGEQEFDDFLVFLVQS